VWSEPDEVPELAIELEAEPALSDTARLSERERWAAACELSARWR
jgi:hypothetical protein